MTDYDSLQADGAQEAHPLWQWTALCGRSHEYANDYGIGLVERDDPDGATLRECDRCLELREDWEQGRGERVA
jgi:hypothetical protein